MKHIIIFLLLQLFNATVSLAAEKVETFHGTVSGITMNGKHFTDIKNQTFTLSRKTGTSGVITGVISKIGKMPGTLHFSIPVTISNDGTLTSKQDTEVGKLKLSVGLSKKLTNKEFKGNIKANKLSFSLRVLSKMLGIKMADASFIFKSE